MDIVTKLKVGLMVLGVVVLLVMLLLFTMITVIVWVNTRSKKPEERIDNEAKDC